MTNQLPAELRAYFSQMGKKSSANMTPEARIERAKKAVEARERKRRQREKEKEQQVK
jgi:pyruvate-formate lyase-activating enzyme